MREGGMNSEMKSMKKHLRPVVWSAKVHFLANCLLELMVSRTSAVDLGTGSRDFVVLILSKNVDSWFFR